MSSRLITPSSLSLTERVNLSGKDSCGCGDSQGSGSKIIFKTYVPPPKKTHDEKNMSLNRPMSPHLTIYAPTLPAMTSIVQRITG